MNNKAVILVLILFVTYGSVYSETPSLLDTLLSLDDHENMKLAEGRERGFLDLQPVILPEGDNLLGVNSHLRHPVAVMVDDTILVAFIRCPAHWKGKESDEYTSPCMVIRSEDRGKTWGQLVDMRTYRRATDAKVKMSFGTGMCADDDGIVYLVSCIGVFRSLDKGESWEHFPEAFTDKQLAGPKTNNGPVIIQHPEYGLVVLGHDTTDGVFPSDKIYIRYSQDKGRTWKEILQENLPPSIKPVEPSGLMYKGSLFIMARSHGSLSEYLDAWLYSMLYSKSGWLPFQTGLSNIQASDMKDWMPYEGRQAYRGVFGPWSQDTVDLSVNPHTNRIEALVTNRNGGGQGKERDYSHMTLNLWSINPECWLAGDLNWRFEGTLLSREGTYIVKPHKEDMIWDGMHPGGSVIDEKNNVQRIFIYLGYVYGPSGIFQLTRSLDTENLSKWLKARN